MIRSTPHDSSMMSILAHSTGASEKRKQELLNELQSPEARQLGEAYLDQQKYAEASAPIQATVDYFRQWVEDNRRLRGEREARRRRRSA
jgi:hypothetical protein